MECAHYREQITRYIDRPLSPDVRMHIEQCPACQRYFDEEATMSAMSNVALAPFRLQGSLSDKILRRLPEADELEDLPTPGARVLWWGAGLAATAAMVIVGFFALSPEQAPLPPENDSGKVHNVATPAGTPQDEPKYEEQCIVIADVVAVDDQRVQVKIATVLRGDSLSYPLHVGERMEIHSESVQDPDGTFRQIQKQFTAGEKIVMTFPHLLAANIENDTIAIPERYVSRVFVWSATREKEIRDEIAREDEWLVTEMYDVTDLTARFGAVEKIVDLVKKSVAPDSWTKPGRSIKAENGVLTISQVRSVHRKIQVYLALKGAEAEGSVSGKVVSYSPALGVVILNVGSENGVREGMEFTISREGAFVASGNAKKVEKTLTLVELKSRESDPRPGDEARWMKEETKTFTPKLSPAEAKAAAMVLELSLALQMYRMDWNTYPTGDGTGSKELAEHLAKNGPRKASYYLFKSDALDGDGNLRSPVGDGNIFYYRSPGIHNPYTYDLWTKDSSGVEDGINNWERRESQGK